MERDGQTTMRANWSVWGSRNGSLMIATLGGKIRHRILREKVNAIAPAELLLLRLGPAADRDLRDDLHLLAHVLSRLR